MEKQYEMAWAAGLFEGEGSLSMTHKRRRASIQLSMSSTDLDVLTRFREVVGFGSVYGPYIRMSERKPLYQWRGHGWANLQQLHDAWSDLLGERRVARFTEVLKAKPAPYVCVQLKHRHLSDEQVLEIRKRLNHGERQRPIASQYGVSQTIISDIKLGRTYKEIS